MLIAGLLASLRNLKRDAIQWYIYSTKLNSIQLYSFITVIAFSHSVILLLFLHQGTSIAEKIRGSFTSQSGNFTLIQYDDYDYDYVPYVDDDDDDDDDDDGNDDDDDEDDEEDGNDDDEEEQVDEEAVEPDEGNEDDEEDEEEEELQPPKKRKK